MKGGAKGDFELLEVLVHKGVVSPEHRDELEAYLRNKWGMAAADPVVTSEPSSKPTWLSEALEEWLP